MNGDGGAHELVGDHPSHLTTFYYFIIFWLDIFPELGWGGLCASQWDAQQLR
jgi:hypothetical protein